MSDLSKWSASVRSKIDAYLDAVDQALLAAQAPRGDRIQVAQDLEIQINEMLNQLSQPTNDDDVTKLLASLESPAKFAASYQESNSELVNAQNPVALASKQPFGRWVIASAIACSCLVFSLVIAATAPILFPFGPPVVGLIALGFAVYGFSMTPLFSYLAYAHARSKHRGLEGKSLLILSVSVYAVLAPLVLVVLGAILTQGFILWGIAIVGLLYAQYKAVRKLRQHLTSHLPDPPAPLLENQSMERSRSTIPPITTSTIPVI